MEKSITKLKKLAGAAVAGITTISLAVCGGSNTAEITAAAATMTTEVETTTVTEGTETETTEVSAIGGIAKGDLKIGFVYIGDESEGYTITHYNDTTGMKEVLGLSDDQIIVRWNISEGETAKGAVMDLMDQERQIVPANSFGHESYMTEAAKEYLDVQSCHATGFQTASSGLSSTHNYFTSIYGTRYASGIVAGLKLNRIMEDGIMKQDACKIGYVGAYPYAEVISGYISFFLGVRSICPDAAMEVKYANSWANSDLEKEATDALISNGHVLTSQHADITGAPTVCGAAGVPCMDYSISMIVTTPNQVLISTSDNWGAYVTETVQHAIDGTEIPANWCRGSSGGMVLITELNEAVAAPGTKGKVDEVETKLVSDELHVFDTSMWTAGSEALDTHKKNGSDIEYISDEYLHESESGSAPSFDTLTDGITTIDN